MSSVAGGLHALGPGWVATDAQFEGLVVGPCNFDGEAGEEGCVDFDAAYVVCGGTEAPCVRGCEDYGVGVAGH